MKRVFTIGERVWFDQDGHTGWGTLGLINREDTYKQYNCDEDDILTVQKDDGGEIECYPCNVYQSAKGLTFFGHKIVWDHNVGQYPLYCPAREENLYMVETEQHLPRITDKPHSYEFYSIEGLHVHVSGYLWHDEDRGWVFTEFTFCYVPKMDLLYRDDGLSRQSIIEEYEEQVQQYEQDGLSDEEALDICNNYADMQRLLNYDEITDETEDGNYVSRVR